MKESKRGGGARVISQMNRALISADRRARFIQQALSGGVEKWFDSREKEGGCLAAPIVNPGDQQFDAPNAKAFNWSHQQISSISHIQTGYGEV